jgi:PAS domain S-box-containing protein
VRARTLHGLIVGLLLYVWIVHIPIIVPLFVTRKAGSTLESLYLTLIYGITLVLLRRGSLRLASVLFLAGTWAAATVFIVLDGGIHSTALAHYVILPILAAWLLGTAAAGAMTAVCLGSSLVLAALQQSGLALPRYFPGVPLTNWSSAAMATLEAVVPVLFVLSALGEALEKRRGAEEALRQANEKLEKRVLERTAQLEEANDFLQIHLGEQKRLEAGLELAARFPGENPTPVMRLGHGHLVDFANPAAQALLRSLGCDVAGEAPAQIAEPAVAALKAGVPRQIEQTYADRTYLFSLAPIPQWNYVNLYATDITERKRAEEALRKREEENRLLADLLENSDQPFAVGYPDGRLGILNGAFERLTGFNRAELTTMDWARALTPSEWREIERAKLDELHLAGQPVRYEKEYLRKDGSRVPIELLVHLRRNDEGQPSFYYSFLTDLTERKQAEEALRESETRERARAAEFEALMEAVPVGIFISQDTECRWMSGNQAAYDLLRRPRGSNLSKAGPENEKPMNFRAMRNGKEIPLADLAMPKAAATGQAFRNQEMDFEFEDGDTVNVLGNVVPLLDEKGGPRGVVGAFLDVTGLKRAEDALRESEERFRGLSEAMPQIVWTADAAGARDYYNPRALEYGGASLSNLTGWNWTSIIHPEDREATLDAWRQAIATEQIYEIEHRLRRADGEFRWHLTRAVPLRNEQAAVIQWIGTATDIHDRKMAEQELERRVAERTAELRESQALTNAIVESTSDFIWTVDPERFGLLTFNAGLSEHFLRRGVRLQKGMGPEEAFADQELAARWRGMYQKALADGSYTTEYNSPTAGFMLATVNLLKRDGKVFAISVFGKDITERKQAETALQNVQARLTALLESTDDLIWSVDLEHRLLTFNKALERNIGQNYGIRAALGMGPEDLLTPARATWWPQAYERALSEGPYRVEYPLLDDRTLELSFNPIVEANRKTGVAVFGKDITERVRAEKALQESEEAFRALAESMPQMVWMCTPDGLNVYFNQRWVDYTGLSLQESYGRGWNTPFHPDDKQPAWQAWNHAVETGDTYNIECRLRRADGIYRWFLTRGVPLRESTGNVVKWFGTCTDIDDLKRAEAELHRLNRALRALSATDQAMVRAQDESELLQETCRILVDEGGYRMAWVGFAEQDEEKTVRLVTHAGINEGYLETVKITWADTERGRGPTGTAIRTGRPTVCQNMLEDPRIAPWREEAARRGYASSCALPLVVGGKPIGALTVYSAVPDAFDAAEADLLVQFGADVAFGLESLRTRAERHRAMEALQKSEARYRTFISHTSDAVWRIEMAEPLPIDLPVDESLKRLFEQGHMAECNPAYAAIYGCSDAEQLIGKRLGELVPTWEEARIDSFRSMARGGFQTRTIELRARDARGKFKDLLRTEIPIVENGLLLRFWGMTRDITEHKQREMELRRLNRALRILSSSNQALVRAEAESQLPQEICRILVEEGGYRMAWMGFAEHDAEKTLRPVASAGIDEGYLASVKLTWADTERGQGPGGVAIRTGQPAVCNNIPEDPQFALWREDALRRGYASTCVLPITLHDKSIAVLAAYSPVPDAFDAAEVKLLVELADDIAYGFHVLHTRAERQQTMETLEKHSAQLAEQARLLELAPVAVLVRDLESRVTYWNRGAEEIYGWTSAEASGKVTHNLLQTKFPEPLDEMEAKIFSGVTWQGELTHHKRTGEEVVVVSRQVLRRDKQGKPTGYLEINLDISARKQAEEALKAERQRFFSVLETLPPMICLLTPDYHVAFANRSFRERFGESQGRRCYDYCFGQSSPCEFCETYDVLKTGQPHHWEVDCPDGSVIDVYDFPFTDVDGTPMILEMDIDITEARRAKEAFEKANAYNRSLLEASLDPLVTISPNGKITDVNRAAEKVTGRLREELIGADFSDYFTDPEKARLGYQQVFKEGLVQDYELEVRRRDGSTTPVLYNASVYRDQGGEVVGVFAAARDITTRKRAEEEVRRLNEELEQRVRLRTAQLEASNKEIESFSYSVSHDLRAPLRAMDGFSRILLEEYRSELPSKAQRYLDFVREGASHMGNLIDGLLALSRLGRQELKRRPVEVAEIVRQSMDDLKADAEGSSAEFVVGSLPSCDADPLLLRQVFVNLLSNALKFSRKQEKVRIEVGALRAPEAAQAPEPVRRLLDPHSWVYFVRDNGVGFDMRYADKLFGVFQRLHRQEDFKGTGIGLATVQQIIHRHGGRVWAEAEVGKGATFYFTVGETMGETNNSHSGSPE